MEKEIEEMLVLTDEFAKLELVPGTPTYDLQQGLIASAKRYREKVTTCEHSGIQFNTEGKTVGFV